MSHTPSKKPNVTNGYKIFTGSDVVSPRRTAQEFGKGGEAWRMSPTGLHEREVAVRRETKGIDDGKVIARKLASGRAAARAGYAVDEKHEWGAKGRHSAYIREAQARVSAANLTLEDALDAVSDDSLHVGRT
jgi:hypothetical protein